MFTLISDEIEDYCEKHSSKEEDILYQLYRETFQKTLRPRMISGHIQGLFLQMISNLVKPKRILELGTFTGYSTICLAKRINKRWTYLYHRRKNLNWNILFINIYIKPPYIRKLNL